MNESNALTHTQQETLKAAHELGIVDLDDRLEFTFDPMSQMFFAAGAGGGKTPPPPPTTNTNCNGCNVIMC